MNWRLGLDIGTNSIGIAALELGHDVEGRLIVADTILDMGVRIFSDGRDPKSKQSLASDRRMPRGLRRNRDRAKNRNERYLRELQEIGLMPVQSAPPTADDLEARKNLEAQDPYILRAKGLDERLEPFQIGRALFNLKRRGFKSNRKTDGGDSENGKIKEAATRTMQTLEAEGCRTLGEWLGRQRIQHHQENASRPKGTKHPLPPARIRLHGSGAKAFYEFYPTRDMILSEFDQLWDAQSQHHPLLMTVDARQRLRETLAFQWPLKAPPVGKCRLDPSQERAPRALPTVQRLRIYQEINHLKILIPGEPARALTLEERDLLVQKALGQNKIVFKTMRNWLKLPDTARFSIETEKRKDLDGDRTATLMAKKDFWGPNWRDLSLADQDTIVSKLLETEEEEALVEWLVNNWDCAADHARALSRVTLPAGHGAFCKEVSDRLLPCLEAGVLTFDKAVQNAGFASHSQFDDGERFPDGLPYYGKVLEDSVAFGSGNLQDPDETRYGKVANPTVHVALNQIRKVVNDMIRRFGTPDQIVVELARDLPLSADGKSKLDKIQRDNQAANDARRNELAKQGQPDSYANRLRLRLWEELNPDDPLDRRCVFTGEQISIARLFSDEVEIEHLLPLSRTLDDSPANKTISMRWANRVKTNKSPFEAFSNNPQGLSWADITERAANLPPNKAWRFAPDAMQRYENEERDFLARQLTDTQYISRLAKRYLEKTGADVWVVPGRLTSDLRWSLGLDSLLAGHNAEEAGDPIKNRADHRHHAIDALVVALTDRSLLQHVATEAGRRADDGKSRLLPSLSDPWPSFRDMVREKLDSLVVSHKPDHGVQGALHNDTAYGVDPNEPDFDGKVLVVHRVPLASLNKHKKLETIRDDTLRAHFQAVAESVSEKDLPTVLQAAGAAMTPPVYKVRVEEPLSVIPIRDKTGKVYKAYKGDSNYCMDIFIAPNGTWKSRVISRFDANQPGFQVSARQSTQGEPLVMRLRINDMLELDHDGRRAIMRVVKMSLDGEIALAEHHETGNLKNRDKDKNDQFKYLRIRVSGLKDRSAVQVFVTPSGRIKHRGNLS